MTDTISKGCLIPHEVCSICSDTGCAHLTPGKITNWTPPKLQPPSLFQVSWVSSPKCPSCKEDMKPADSTQWHCVEDTCDRYHKRINTGVMPMRAYLDTFTGPKC